MFGIFDALGDIMLYVLNFFYQWTNSYGVSIILLTFVFRGMMYPLTRKQTQSMQAMQDIQPKMEKLKEKYEDQPDVYQKKTIELYKEEGVNPAGGCLPLLVQMPIFIALFRVLSDFPELKDTSFLWIENLGGPDVVLILMTAAGMYAQTFIQNKLSGRSGSANKMMLFMPLFIVFIGWNLPAGVLLYWFTSNLLMMLQQILITRDSKIAQEEAS